MAKGCAQCRVDGLWAWVLACRGWSAGALQRRRGEAFVGGQPALLLRRSGEGAMLGALRQESSRDSFMEQREQDCSRGPRWRGRWALPTGTQHIDTGSPVLPWWGAQCELPPKGSSEHEVSITDGDARTPRDVLCSSATRDFELQACDWKGCGRTSEQMVNCPPNS